MQKLYRDKNGRFTSKHLAVVKPKRTGKVKSSKKDIDRIPPISKHTSKKDVRTDRIFNDNRAIPTSYYEDLPKISEKYRNKKKDIDIGNLNSLHKLIPIEKTIAKIKVKPYTTQLEPTHKIYTNNEMESLLDNLLLNTQLEYTKRRDIEKLQLNLYIRKQYGSSITRALRIKELSKRVFNDNRAMNKEDIDILQK